MARRDNLAYDISIYENLPKKQAEPKIRVKKNTRKKTISAFKSLMVATFTGFVLCAILYGNVRTTELYSYEAELKAEIAEVNSENDRMEAELESKISLNSIDSYAVDVLGLQKLEKTQIQYLEVDNSNFTKVEVEEGKSVFDTAKDWFFSVLEYIGI